MRWPEYDQSPSFANSSSTSLPPVWGKISLSAVAKVDHGHDPDQETVLAKVFELALLNGFENEIDRKEARNKGRHKPQKIGSGGFPLHDIFQLP